jgi:hypothetical protein|tara:strand:- start:114 stop:512 length:399 start_codon:yes stop_codon:yes gene_type:complete
MSFTTQADPAFNMGSDTLSRINFQLWILNVAKSKSNFDDWFNALRNVFCEAYAFLTESERIYQKDLRDKAEAAYNSLNVYNINFNKIKRAHTYSPPKYIYDAFIDWELELRIHLDKHGLLMKKGEAALGSII